jgi:hypothetical protein
MGRKNYLTHPVPVLTSLDNLSAASLAVYVAILINDKILAQE